MDLENRSLSSGSSDNFLGSAPSGVALGIATVASFVYTFTSSSQIVNYVADRLKICEDDPEGFRGGFIDLELWAGFAIGGVSEYRMFDKFGGALTLGVTNGLSLACSLFRRSR
jgi:hypothetical protein